MKVGDYVRTEKGIAKITKIFSKEEEPYEDAKYQTDTYLEIYYDSEYISDYYIIKSSPRIIKLIQQGDYVNGYKVFNIETSHVVDNNYNRIGEKIRLDIGNDMYGYTMYIEENDIKSVLTKECFESMKYEIK